jgi:hypothetical protein
MPILESWSKIDIAIGFLFQGPISREFRYFLRRMRGMICLEANSATASRNEQRFHTAAIDAGTHLCRHCEMLLEAGDGSIRFPGLLYLPREPKY